MKSGNWRLVVCGVSHKTSALEQREHLQLGTTDMPKANALFGSLSEVLESAIVSTCNRVEFYFVTSRNNDPFDVVASFYEQFKSLDIEPYRDLFRTKKGKHAADHFFQVAAGIDSMILGENQILGQIKHAYSSACSVNSPGKVIHRLFHQAFRVGKRVRTDTEIGAGTCSVSSAAIEMLDDILDMVRNPAVLFIGVNQMIRLAANRLAKLDNCRLVFANRTPEKAVEFAAGFDTDGHGLDQLPRLIADADVIISCTSSEEPIITEQIMEAALEKRAGADGKLRKLVIMDMAIPRDADLPKDSYPSVELFDLDNIKRSVKNRQHQRELALPQVEEIIERKLSEFEYWYEHVLHEPIYNGHSNTIESLREEELAQIIEKLPPELQGELNQATRRIVNRVIQIARRTHSQKSK